MSRNRILAAVSFGPQSDAALKYARKIASTDHGMISCLYVVEEPGFVTRSFISKEMQQRIRREAELALTSKVRSIFSGPGNTPFEIIVSYGKVYQKILETAADLNASMIVMGRSDSTDLNKDILGTNASMVIARSDVPVCSVRGSANLNNAKVLLPLDLSKFVSLKIAKAIELAQRFHWKLVLCAIIVPEKKNQEPAYRNRLKEIKQIIAEHEINCVARVVLAEQSIPEEILSVAEKDRAGHIFLMTQKEESEADMLIGSTARFIIKRSRLPILSLTPDVQTSLVTFKSLFASINLPIHP
jgi:nucleotide-binding universal stress UspA family protein